MKKLLTALSVFTILSSLCSAQNPAPAPVRDPAYVAVIAERSQKIVDNLQLKEDQKEPVKTALINHYYTLNDIYDSKEDVQGKLYKHHFNFISSILMVSDSSVVDKIKNALTYNVLEVTYNSYIDMIPTLTETNKHKIYVWLLEAREQAIDGESSNKKHEIFGKYKGRINNYLSAEGYNLTKEREEWAKRISARKERK